MPLRGLLQTFLKSPCPLCAGGNDGGLCQLCQQQLYRCRLNIELEQKASELSVLAWGSYQGHLRQAIGALKYKQQPEIARFLGMELGRLWPMSSIAQQGVEPPAVIPIPLHPEKLAQRGYNQAELLSHWFCRATQLRHYPQGLIRVRATEAQHRLNATQRQQNLKGAFALGNRFPAEIRSVLLLDDIYTTGATARAAAQTLENRGVSVVGMGVIARAISAKALISP